jgi:hypothetical protein
MPELAQAPGTADLGDAGLWGSLGTAIDRAGTLLLNIIVRLMLVTDRLLPERGDTPSQATLAGGVTERPG